MFSGSTLTSRPSSLSLGEESLASEAPRPPESPETPKFSIFGWTPDFSFRWRSPVIFLALFCSALLTQSGLFSYLRGTSSFITKYTAFSSKELGYLTASAELVWIFISIPLAHFLSKKDGPSWMTIANVTFVLGVFCYVSIAFVPSNVPVQDSLFCNENLDISSTLENHDADDLIYSQSDVNCYSPSVVTILLWWFGSSLTSVGSWLFIVLGTTYLDNNVKKDTSLIYVAIAITCRLGGILLGSSLSAVHNDTHRDKNGGLPPLWWIFLIVHSLVLLCGASLMSFFPRHIIKPKPRPVFHLQTEDGDISAIEIGENSAPKPTWRQYFYKNCYDLYDLNREILAKKHFLWCLMGDFLAFTGSFGLFMWLPKYLESHFRVNGTDSAVYTGISCTSSVIIGILGSALFLRQCRPSTKNVVLMMASSKAIYACILVAMSFLSCEVDADLPGAISPQTMLLDPVFECASGCDCSSWTVSPVCLVGEDIRETFLSPCHAGCPPQDQTSPSELPNYFYNCSCLGSLSYVQRGYCEETCSQFTVYNMLNVLVNALVSVGLLGATLITIRSTNVDQKAMGMTWKLLCVSLAYVVSQVLYQNIEDWTCLLWKTRCSQTNQDCLIHDSTMLGYKLHGFTSVLYLLSSFCDMMVSFNADTLRLMSQPRRRGRRTQSSTSVERSSETISVKSLRQTLLRHLSAPSAHQAQRTRQ